MDFVPVGHVSSPTGRPDLANLNVTPASGVRCADLDPSQTLDWTKAELLESAHLKT